MQNVKVKKNIVKNEKERFLNVKPKFQKSCYE